MIYTTEEILDIIRWYFSIQLLSVFIYPLIARVFHNYPDKGHGLTKIAGVIVFAFPIWLLASLKLVPFRVEFSLPIVVCLGSIIWLFFLRKYSLKSIKSYLRENKQFLRTVLVEEILFLIIFLFFVYGRSFLPRLESTEKFMDYAFINSFSKQDYFPPENPWLAGFYVNYYYYGQYIVSFLSKITIISPNHSYLFENAIIIAQTFLGCFSILFFITKRRWSSILGGVAACFFGNLDYGVKCIGNVLTNFENKTNTPLKYWFADSTRLIPNTINEYPMYSVVLGDLHGHYLNLPVFVLMVALIGVIIEEKRFKLAVIFLTAIILGTSYASNSWDFLTGTTFLIFAASYVGVTKVSSTLSTSIRRNIDYDEILKKVFRVAKTLFREYLNVIISIILAFLLFLPFILNFDAPVGGIGINHENSPLSLLFIIWGGFIAPIITLLMLVIFKKVKLNMDDIYPILIIFVGFCLVIGVEVLYVKDIFSLKNPTYFRTNTVFKFYYEAWVLFGLGAAYAIWRILSNKEKNLFMLEKVKDYYQLTFDTTYKLFVVPTLILFTLMAMYPIRAVQDWLFGTNFLPNGRTLTLDGNYYISLEYPEDFALINWMNKNIKGTPVIVEASKNQSYSYYSRIATNTGFIGVIGWPFHIVQWHGEDVTYYTDIEGDLSIVEPYKRIEDVTTLYQGTSEQALEIVKKYKIEYIVVGAYEEKEYGAIDITKFYTFGQVVYERNGTFLIQVNSSVLSVK